MSSNGVYGGVTYDELAEFLACRRDKEHNRSLSDIEILTKERDKRSYLIGIYLVISFSFTAAIPHRLVYLAIVPALSALLTFVLMNKERRINELIGLQLARRIVDTKRAGEN